MSYMDASDPRDLWAFAGVAAIFGGVLFWSSWRARADSGRIVSQCADGSVIGAKDRGVRHRPGRIRPAAHGWQGRRERPPEFREDLEPGDLSFLRIREGGVGEASWVVEGVDYDPVSFGIHWEFETADTALAAYRLLDERIARPPLDVEGRTTKLADREFDSLWSEWPAIAGGSAAPNAAGTP